MLYSNFVLVLLSFALSCNLISSFNYCQLENECRGMKRHIACHPEQLPRRTENYTRIAMSRKLRDLIISEHNKYRNHLACGTLTDMNSITYPPAAKMRELVWDYELEYLAGVHVEQCVVRQDECRLSSRYKRVGQSLAALTGNIPNTRGLKVVAAAQKLINEWFVEHRDASYKNANLYQGESHTQHFTLMVNDRISRLGCALALCSITDDHHIFLLTCNYSYKNMKDEEVYTTGAFVSKCARINSRASRNYRCLCAPSGD